MYRKKKLLAFIGARSGSKRLKNKNTLDFMGKPLMGWTIEAALQSKFIDEVIVSTDSSAIARIAKLHGASVPFLRPPTLAKDSSLIEPAIRHSLKWLKRFENKTFDYVLSLQPTSPLRTTAHIDKAILTYFKEKKGPQDTLVSVYEISRKYGWILRKNQTGYIDFCIRAKNLTRSQNLPTLFMPNGAIYIAPREVIQKTKFYNKRTIPFVMKSEESIDIDSPEDFATALMKFKPRRSHFTP